MAPWLGLTAVRGATAVRCTRGGSECARVALEAAATGDKLIEGKVAGRTRRGGPMASEAHDWWSGVAVRA
eukprot:2351926-Pleurochrysis_carterae.AAC.1